MHTFMLILRVVSIRIHFLLVDTDYSKSLFIFNTFKSSHKSDDIKANSSFVLFNSRQRFFLSEQVRKQIRQQEQSYFSKPAMVVQVLLWFCAGTSLFSSDAAVL